MIRVLLATPVKYGFDTEYLRGIVSTLEANHADVKYIPVVTDSTYVNYARNSLVDAARRNKCDEVLQIDSDMQWLPRHVERIRSHGKKPDVDIVGGRYAKRKDGEAEWLYHPMDGATVRPDGLLEVHSVATGFLWTRVSVFDRLFEFYKDRHYTDKVSGEGEVRCEYFPIGICGGSSAERRINMLRELITTDGVIRDPAAALHALYGDLGPGFMQGEDYSFCRLARQAGFKVYVDTQCTLRHLGLQPFPRDEFMRPYNPEEIVT